MESYSCEVLQGYKPNWKEEELWEIGKRPPSGDIPLQMDGRREKGGPGIRRKSSLRSLQDDAV